MGTGRNDLAGSGWRDETVTRPASWPPLPGRDHRPCSLALPRVQPEPERCRAAAGRTGRDRLLRERPPLVSQVRPELRRQAAPAAAEAGRPGHAASQVEKLKQRFHLTRVAVVGDRGMITEARIDTLLKPAGLAWITALRAPTMQKLLQQGALQLSLFEYGDDAASS
jgi:hypothetical protein